MKPNRHAIASMTRFAVVCSCRIRFNAPSHLREQPDRVAFDYLLDYHRTHRQHMKNRGLLREESPEEGHDVESS